MHADDVVDARQQLHWAAQTIAAAADILLDNRADDSHTNMRWDDDRRALVGHRTNTGVALALLVEDLALTVFDDAGGEVHRLSLTGHTLDAAMAWVAEAMGSEHSLYPRSYSMPGHAVGRGGRFQVDHPDALAEVARWFATANAALGELSARADGATGVAVWPHHFDLGGVVSLDPHRSLNDAPQIGYGMSPGDATYAEPYYYVTPWPVPSEVRGPALPFGGHWRHDGWTGAVLTASALTEIAGADARAAAVRDFVDVAIAAGRSMIPPTA